MKTRCRSYRNLAPTAVQRVNYNIPILHFCVLPVSRQRENREEDYVEYGISWMYQECCNLKNPTHENLHPEEKAALTKK
ncbi:hypothetical protein STEG23_013205, partial [Scotinomys teguina]